MKKQFPISNTAGISAGLIQLANRVRTVIHRAGALGVTEIHFKVELHTYGSVVGAGAIPDVDVDRLASSPPHNVLP